MKLLLFSPVNNHQEELSLLLQFFEQGLETYHLRKPHLSRDALESFIQKIPRKYHSHIMLHSHHYLVEKYCLKGCHFTEKERGKIDKLIKKKGGLYSTGFHSVQEAKESLLEWDYIFLSPIYDSISKHDYKSQFSDEILKTEAQPLLKQQNVIALGGIKKSNILSLKSYGFIGYGIIGSIWNSTNPLRDFEEFMKME